MSVTDRRRRPDRDSLTSLPEFDLDYLFDDEDEPTEVTVFPARFGEDLATNWITMDVTSVVPLDQVR